MKIGVVRQDNCLKPATDYFLQELMKMKEGKFYSVTYREDRNLMHHNKLMAILRCTVANSERFSSVESLLDCCKLSLGHTEITSDMAGGVRAVKLKSIRFERMDQRSFEDFYTGAVKLCADHIGVTVDELENGSDDYK